MELSNFVELLTALERETNGQKRQEAEEFYFKLRDDNPELFVNFTVQLIEESHPQAGFATILFRRDCDKRGLGSALYECPNVHEIVVSLLPYLLQQNHLLEIITQHLELCLQKSVPFSEFLPFFQRLCEENKELAAQLTAEILTLPISLLSRIDIDFVGLAMAFLAENDAVAALAMKSLANYAFLRENGLSDEEFYQILGRYQQVVENDELTCDLKVLDAMNQQISRIIDSSKGLVEKVFIVFIELVETMFLKSENKEFQLRMLKIGNKFISALENAQEAFPVIKGYLQKCVIPSAGMYENYQLEEWIQLGNIEFEADDLIQNAEKIVETMSIKWASSVVNPALQECFQLALTSSDFKYEIACLMSLNFAAEGFVDVVPLESLEFYINSIIQLVNIPDQHPRVLFSAANVIGQIANDFDQQIAKYHHIILPVLLRMSDHPVIHVRSHFVAAMLNVTITMQNSEILPYAASLKQLVERNWADNDLYMRSNILSTLCTLIEVSSEQDIQELLCGILPQVLDLFEQIMAPVSADEELTKTELDLVQRVIEVLGFSMSYFPHLFGDIAQRVVEAYQQVMSYAYSHRVVDLLNQSVRSLLKTEKLVDYTPIIADEMALFYDCVALPFISFRKDVQGEGDMCIDSNVTGLQIAVFQLIAEEAERSPAYFVQHYAKIVKALSDLNSPNETVSMMQIELNVNMLRVAAEISPEVYYNHIQVQLEQFKENVDDTSINGKHFEIETLQFVYESLTEFLTIIRDNSQKYGFLEPACQLSVLEILHFQAEHTAVLLDEELALVARVRADAGETQKLVKQLVLSYFAVYELLSNCCWPLLQASGAGNAAPELLSGLHEMAISLMEESSGSNEQRDAPIVELAISILADLARAGMSPEQSERDYVLGRFMETDNPRLLYYCAYFLLFCGREENSAPLNERCLALYESMEQSSASFAGHAKDYIILLMFENGQKSEADTMMLFNVMYDSLAVELAVKELLLLPESPQIGFGLQKMKEFANKMTEVAIEEYCKRVGV